MLLESARASHHPLLSWLELVPYFPSSIGKGVGLAWLGLTLGLRNGTGMLCVWRNRCLGCLMMGFYGMWFVCVVVILYACLYVWFACVYM